MTSSKPSTHEAPPPAEADASLPLQRSRSGKVVGGVCAGLGRHFDLDPVIFRITVGVLSVTGGVGLIFYGFAWLLVPLAGEDEHEGRRLLTGRVTGATLAAIFMALTGCGIFLTTLRSGSMLGFTMLLSLAVCGAAVWSRRRAVGGEAEGRTETGAAHVVVEAPPETKAPPRIEYYHSWWKDPIVKDGSTGRVTFEYLWGPHGIVDKDGKVDGVVPKPGSQWGPDPSRADRPTPSVRRTPLSIAGLTHLLAMVAAVLGTALTWETEPLGTSLQTGLVAALAVFGLGLVISSFLGRTGFGTIVNTVITACLLAGAVALPDRITTDWVRETWKPATVAAVQPSYELGTGVGLLDLSALPVPAGTTVTTRADVGAGQLKVVVPKDVVVKLHAEVGLGDLKLPGQPAEDIDIAPDRDETHTIAPPAGTAPAGTLDLSLEVGIGQVEVTRAAS
ncbi:integral membrane protein [Streptomyces venezuelae]|uniref:PspC domain-containing protein n=1 Tax=Streptomyces gardneri TaxID=66892 RepID=UPI0006E38811|nr:PspC domain-containing protein [Streptomyces gardneri]ALO10509.1 integral membrane protein [Streptomyces venezuelae]QPK47507.1 PspC domain-containing protein [Streptomyces gardneri]WRK38941.1 PspC domain-containing protein [Streptomyces venezuelae]